MNSHQCEDCDHKFFDAGQSQDSISPAVQCPQCHSYRTQPVGIPDESNEMLHGLQAMPTSTEDDMSGNPLKEGILADGGWKNRQVRDESFAASTKRSDFPSLFESPEFETTGLVAPPDLYRHAMETEAAHQAGVQLPHGITDNLHAALGNLQAWVENPYENGQLRPYNKYWKVIRPSYMKPGSLRIGVADPTMAEIINHVAQTDDPTPLYEYRGKESKVAAFAIPEAAALAMGGADVGAGAAAAGSAAEAGGAAASGAELASGAADAAGAAGATGTDLTQGVGNNLTLDAPGAASAQVPSEASGIGGIMQGLKRGIPLGGGMEVGKGLAGPVMNYADDFLGAGSGGGAPGGGAGGGGMPIQDASFYARVASDEDDAYPDSHGEIPKNEDGDHKQQDDGNHHEWQRDISVNDGGGTDHSPSFDPAGSGMQRFKMLWPLIQQFMESGEDASQDPLIEGLHQTLEGELPGYLDHGNPEAAQRLVMVLSPNGDKQPAAEPEKNEPDHTDENSGGKHHSKIASLNGDVAEFLPDLTVTPPFLRGYAATNPADIARGMISGPIYPNEEVLDSGSWPKSGPEECPYCGHYGNTALGLCARCGREIYSQGADQAHAMEYMGKTADTQGPHSPEQIKMVQEWLMQNGQKLGLEGDELIQTVLSVPTNPLDFADILAKIQQAEPPPQPPEDAGMSANPPMPPQENAPPGATMPVPGMEQQMMGAVQRYAADSVAGKCPECGSHTTEILDEEGASKCHACQNVFKTEGKTPLKLTPTSSWNVLPMRTWRVDDLRKEAEVGDSSHDFDLHSGDPIQGVPIADQTQQRDVREEQDSSHTWTDEDGNPLKVGQEYEMASQKYDIPDLVRIEAVKPNSIVYTLTGEFGLEHSTELTREEANIERVSFRSSIQDGELGMDDSLEENNDDHTGYSGEPERNDASAPSGLVASVIESGVVQQVNPKLGWLKEGGANFTPMEQRALIDESGTARNADLLDLGGTHYVQDADDDQFLFGL